MQNRKHTRVSLACEECRNRKRRCDAVKPTCGYCSRHNVGCVYASSVRPSMTEARFAALENRVGYIDKLESRIKALEHALYGCGGSFQPHSGQSQGNIMPHAIIAADSEVTDRHGGPVPTFNDRLARMKAHTSGDQENSTIYLSGAFFSILNPSDIGGLSEKLGDPFLWEHLENTSYNVWRRSHECLEKVTSIEYDFEPDPAFLKKCVDIYVGCDSSITRLFLPPDEVASLKHNDLSRFEKGIASAVIIVGCASMRMSYDSGLFSESDVETQERWAIYWALRTLSLVHFCQPNFFLIRLWTLLLWLLFVFNSVPSKLRFLKPILDAAKSIGLDDARVNLCFSRPDAEWRETVWFFTTFLEYCLAIPLSFKPHAAQALAPQALGRFFSEEHVMVLKYSAKLHFLFDSIHENFFALPDKSVSPDDTLRNILRTDYDLSVWLQEIPMSIWNAAMPLHPRLADFLNYFPIYTLHSKYNHVVVAIHSIPAFCPEFLPQVFNDSIWKVSKAAKALFEAATVCQAVKGHLSPLHVIGVTESVCCFLFKQIHYPADGSNLEEKEMLVKHLRHFTDIFPFSSIRKHPVSEIWEFLVKLMSQFQEIHNLRISTEYNEIPPDTVQHDGQCNIQ